jgi:hypothetical protein
MKATDDRMRTLVGGATTPIDEQLGNCVICSCHNRTMVHLTGVTLAAAGNLTSLSRYPANCWKHTCNR